MKFHKINLNNAFVIEPQKIEDERGFFARTWDKKQLEEFGLNSKIEQCSISFNAKKGTLRGMHYQISPYEETKIVRCTRGKIFDVIIDLRQDSKTFMKWFGTELSAENHKMLYIPAGLAHGFQTLEDNTEVFYEISDSYNPLYSRGIKWNDETFQIKWPMKPTVMSKKDLSFKNFEVERKQQNN